MLFWEILFVVFMLIAAFAFTVGTVYRWDQPIPRWAAGLAVLCLLILWMRSELRWQLYPGYGIAAFLFLLSFSEKDYMRLSRMRWFLQVVATKLIAIIALASVLIAWALPVVALPAPTGAHQIGTSIFHLVDDARKEIYTENPNDNREIMVQAWYPAKPDGDATPVRWMPDLPVLAPVIIQTLAERDSGPSFMLDHLAMIDSNSYLDAPVAGDHEHYPVVIYSHGWTGYRTVAANECEALASHGYVVVAADHVYGAMGSVYPDGRVALLNRNAMPDRDPAEAYQAGIELLVDNFAGDVRLLIDYLHKMETGEVDSPLAGRLDLDRLGLFGHSTGGGAITEVYLTDPRVKAAVGLDPWVVPVSPELRTIRVDKPYLSLRSNGWVERRGDNSAILNGMLPNFGGRTYDWYLADSKHNDFTLMPFLSPLIGRLGVSGPISAARGAEVIDGTLVAFFDEFLGNGAEMDFDDPAATYPELVVTPEGL